MAGGTIGGVSSGLVIGVSGCIVVVDMASGASVGRVDIVTIMASGTVVSDGRMGTFDHIIIIVYGEGSWIPSWLGGVTRSAVVRDADGTVIGIGRLIKIGGMTIHTQGGSTSISVDVTTGTVDRSVSAGEREVGQVMIEVGWLPGCL